MMYQDAVSLCQALVSKWIPSIPYIRETQILTATRSAQIFPRILPYGCSPYKPRGMESVLLIDKMNDHYNSTVQLMNASSHPYTRSIILLINDTLTSSSTMIDYIRRQRYSLTTVKTEHEAIALTRKTRHAAIMLDSGREEANRASLFHSLAHIDPLLPIIILLTETDSRERNDFVKLGAFDVLRSPIQEQELTKVLERVATVGELRNVARRATHQLMVHAERYQSIMESARDAIILGDHDGQILSWNKAAQHMFGYSAAEVIGKPLTLLMPHRYHKSHVKGLQNVKSHSHMQTTTEKTLELYGLRKAGEEFPIELSLTRSSGTTEQFYCGIIRNITARKQREMELLERSRILALDTDVGHALSDDQPLAQLLQGCAEALIRHLNAKFVRIWTLNSTTQVLELQASAGLSSHRHGSQASIPLEHFKIREIAKTKRPFLSNSIIRDPSIPDQTWAKREDLVAFAGYPLMKNQQVMGVMALFSDHPLTSFTLNSLGMIGNRMTIAIEREMAREAYQKLSRHSEQILVSAEEGIYGLNRNCHITFINRAGASILGYAADELVGRSIHAAIHHSVVGDGQPSNEFCPMCRIVKTGTRHHIDTECLWRKDHSRFAVEYTSTPIWEDELLMGAIITFQDITERKRMAEQLLEEARLAEVTRVMGDVTHDMKNMLMPVLSGATLMEEELREYFANLPNSHLPETEATKNFATEALSVIINNTRRLHRRVREIADTVKGSIAPPRFVSCRISDIVNSVFEALHLYAAEKTIDLSSCNLDALPSIHADESRLFNAFYNLVNNAIPETPPGGTITIAGEALSDAHTILLTVTDTGGGMPSEVRDSLFTEKTISRKVGGTGLGTKIVKDAIDDHGGTISVNSKPGCGTTFTITLPVGLTAMQTC